VRFAVKDLNSALLFTFFVLGIVVGSIFVLTAHNCCCEAPHCQPVVPACVDCEGRLQRLERIVFKQGATAE